MLHKQNQHVQLVQQAIFALVMVKHHLHPVPQPSSFITAQKVPLDQLSAKLDTTLNLAMLFALLAQLVITAGQQHITKMTES
jgi:hypothetical protein